MFARRRIGVIEHRAKPGSAANTWVLASDCTGPNGMISVPVHGAGLTIIPDLRAGANAKTVLYLRRQATGCHPDGSGSTAAAEMDTSADC